jgi:UDP:flavonoid glycosyltransferase YjiC (YdhE family)
VTARILYAWELGGNLGHIGGFIPLARRLLAGGASVECALAHTAGAAALLAPESLSWTQAPMFRGALSADLHDPPLSYADILLLRGYADPGELLGLVGAWRRLIELSRATLVLADHAPTAILAARTLGVPVMLHGTGFHAPPDVSPIPEMRPWAPTAAHILEASQRRALRTINTVLEALAATPLDRLGQLFEVAEPALVTFSELDHYPGRQGARYWGVKPSFAAAPPVWPPGEGPRLFGYLRAGHSATLSALTALEQTGARTLVYCPDAPPEWKTRFAASHLSIVGEPVDLAQAGQEADGAVLYAQHGTTAALLRSGIPLVLAPETVEQGMLAWRVDAMGAGFMVGPRNRHFNVASALSALLSSDDCKSRAMEFARKYATTTPNSVVEAMAGRALRLAAG